jgi:hypothetical protein
MLVGFFDRGNFAPLIGAALAAGAMGELALVAVGTLGGAGGGEEVVGAALGCALLGVAPFGVRHGRFLSGSGDALKCSRLNGLTAGVAGSGITS